MRRPYQTKTISRSPEFFHDEKYVDQTVLKREGAWPSWPQPPPSPIVTPLTRLNWVQQPFSHPLSPGVAIWNCFFVADEEVLPHLSDSLSNALPSLRRVPRSAETTPAPPSAAPETQPATTPSANPKETTGSISVIAVEVQLPRMRARFYTKPKVNIYVFMSKNSSL